MADVDTARKLALSLPEATEEPYHHVTSFHVPGKVFATVPDDEHLHLMLSEGVDAQLQIARGDLLTARHVDHLDVTARVLPSLRQSPV